MFFSPTRMTETTHTTLPTPLCKSIGRRESRDFGRAMLLKARAKWRKLQGTLSQFPTKICNPQTLEKTNLGAGKRGHHERGFFTGGISRISKISRFSRISRKWSDSPLFSTVWGFSKISKISKFSRISRKWTFRKRPLFRSRKSASLSGTGDSQRDSRESIRANRFAIESPIFYSANRPIRTNHSNFRFAIRAHRFTRITPLRSKQISRNQCKTASNFRFLRFRVCLKDPVGLALSDLGVRLGMSAVKSNPLSVQAHIGFLLCLTGGGSRCINRITQVQQLPSATSVRSQLGEPWRIRSRTPRTF